MLTAMIRTVSAYPVKSGQGTYYYCVVIRTEVSTYPVKTGQGTYYYCVVIRTEWTGCSLP